MTSSDYARLCGFAALVAVALVLAMTVGVRTALIVVAVAAALLGQAFYGSRIRRSDDKKDPPT